MNVTYIKSRNRYVDQAGRVASVTEYGKDFINCNHDFQDTHTRGTTPGPNGKHIAAAAYRCTKCLVYTIIEMPK